VPADLDSLLERLDARPAAADSLEGQRLHRTVRARLLDETVPETRIDRFVITGRLGVGGMGVVYAAHDAQLDRKLAIKLVRHSDPAQRERDQQRLIREAQSLARLSHPNVVAIYDVGLHDDRVFIAMELVVGTTLRRWVGEGTRPWDEVLRCVAQAGEGLAAAHAAGIVHRDFKPDNVLVGDDGRVRVLDFGLAQGDGTVPTGAGFSPDAMISASLTATGKVAGTPAYMAPEQFAGAAADPRTDQFSFCVACWEALFLERPYPATTTAQLRSMIAEGAIAEPSRADRAPAWLRDVLARGLAADPGARWPSMRALLDACSPPPGRRRPWVLVGAIVVGGSVATIGGVASWQSHRRSDCEREAAELAAVWGPSTAEEIADAFAGTELVHARHTAEQLDGVLDDYATTWRDHRAQSCIANVDDVIDDAAWQLRRACLDDRRERLATLVEVLHAPDREIVNEALRTAYALPLPSACDDDVRLAANASALLTTLDAEAAGHVRRRIARAELLTQTARPDAMVVALAARDDASALGDPGLIAESELALGGEHFRLGDYQAAADAYERAYFIAAPMGADQVALMAATALVDVVGGRLARFDEGIAWSRHAEVLLPRSGTSRPWREAELVEKIAYVARERGDDAVARESYERAIALLADVAGPDHPALGRAWFHLGGLLASRRETDGTAQALDEAERILVAAFGRDAMPIALIYTVRGTLEFNLGHTQTAIEHFERALAIREAVLEPDHPSIAVALSSLANARLVLGELTDARALLIRAVELRRRKLGSQHPLLADALHNLGLVEFHIGDVQAAQEHLTEALHMRRALLPANHPLTASTLSTLGDVFRYQREFERALASYDEVVQMPTSDSDVLAREQGFALSGRGLMHMQLGEPAKARADLEAALATPFGKEPDPATQCEVHYKLARAIVETGGDRTRAGELVRTAAQECRDAGERGAALLDELSAWAREAKMGV